MSTGTLQPWRGAASLGKRWDRWLNGLLQRAARPESLSRVARLPLGGFFARRQARALFDLVSGFTATQTVLACVRLRVFERLLAEAQTDRLYALLSPWGRRPAQRVTRSEQDIKNMRGKSLRKGILPFLYDGSEVDEELTMHYRGPVSQKIEE